MLTEGLAAAPRPRVAWEAVDHGSAMFRVWAGPVYRAWFVTAFPVMCLVYLLLHNRPWLASLVVWWLKPLYDEIVLFVLSRSVFGETPTVRQTLRGKLWRRRLLLALVGHRFDPMRSFLMPVWFLEGLRGADLKARRRVLSLHGPSGAASGLTYGALFLELVVALGVVSFLVLLFPSLLGPDIFTTLDIARERGTIVYWQLGYGLVHITAISIIEPLYVAGGFGLYVNRRTLLEGWDIELTFRQLARRVAPLLVALTACIALWTPSAGAQELTPEEAIENVLASEEFGSEVERRQWRPRWEAELEGPRERPDTGFVAGVIEFVVWTALALLVLYLGYKVVLVWLERTGPVKGERFDFHTRKGVLAEDERVERPPLPADVGKAAWSLWTAGAQAGSLSLLYRAAIESLDVSTLGAVTTALTEGQWLRHARRSLDGERLRYFESVVRVWQQVAYGHRTPSDETVRALCTEWQQTLGGVR